MAVVDRVSTLITNATSSPIVFNNGRVAGAPLYQARAVITTAADDSQNSIGRFLRLPSNAIVASVTLSMADATTGGAVDIGLYQTAGNGGAVVDADLFASAFALTNGPYSNVDITFESGEYTFAESLTPLWAVIGLSADPGRHYDLAYTITTTFNGAGTSMLLTAAWTI